jgi:hypothetical protein
MAGTQKPCVVPLVRVKYSNAVQGNVTNLTMARCSGLSRQLRLTAEKRHRLLLDGVFSLCVANPQVQTPLNLWPIVVLEL